MSQEYTLIAISFVVIVMLYAVAKGRSFRFSGKKGDAELKIDIAEKQRTEPEASKNFGSISKVSVLDQGRIQNSENVNVHIGHSIEKK